MRTSVIIATVGFIACSMPNALGATLQANCLVQAKQTYYDIETDERAHLSGSDVTKGTRTLSRHYKSHYNKVLKKCFLLIITKQFMGGFNSNAYSKTLIEARTQQQYAKYLIFFSHKTPVVCELSPPEQKQRVCRDRSEFNTFVGHYMME